MRRLFTLLLPLCLATSAGCGDSDASFVDLDPTVVPKTPADAVVLYSVQLGSGIAPFGVHRRASVILSNALHAQLNNEYSPSLNSLHNVNEYGIATAFVLARDEPCITRLGRTTTYACEVSGLESLAGSVTVTAGERIDIELVNQGPSSSQETEGTIRRHRGVVSGELRMTSGPSFARYTVEARFTDVHMDRAGCPTSGTLTVVTDEHATVGLDETATIELGAGCRSVGYNAR